MERLVEFHTALGGSTIILSATLSAKERQMLVNAFCDGLAGTCVKIKSDVYPLLTAVSREGISEVAVEMREELRRKLPVKRIPRVDTAIDEVCAAAEQGAAVAWIRNAVDDCIDARIRAASVFPAPVTSSTMKSWGPLARAIPNAACWRGLALWPADRKPLAFSKHFGLAANEWMKKDVTVRS